MCYVSVLQIASTVTHLQLLLFHWPATHLWSDWCLLPTRLNDLQMACRLYITPCYVPVKGSFSAWRAPHSSQERYSAIIIIMPFLEVSFLSARLWNSFPFFFPGHNSPPVYNRYNRNSLTFLHATSYLSNIIQNLDSFFFPFLISRDITLWMKLMSIIPLCHPKQPSVLQHDPSTCLYYPVDISIFI